MKMLNFIIEAIYWFSIFISPVLISGLIGFAVYHHYDNQMGLLLFTLLLTVGILSGIFFAERIRRTVGCTNFMTRMTPWKNSAEIGKDTKEQE